VSSQKFQTDFTNELQLVLVLDEKNQQIFCKNSKPQTSHTLSDTKHENIVGLSSEFLISSLNTLTRSIWKMLGPFATTSRLTPIHQVSPLYCRMPPAHRCPRRQRQRVTEGTAMAPWNGPNKPYAYCCPVKYLVPFWLTMANSLAFTVPPINYHFNSVKKWST